MVKAAKADIVCPTVATEDPEGLLGEVALIGEKLCGLRSIGRAKLGYESLGSLLTQCRIRYGINPCLSRILKCLACFRRLGEPLSNVQEMLLLCLVAKHEAHAMLGIVLKQRVVPRRTMAVSIGCKGRARRRVTPDGRAARCIGDIHTIAKELGHQTAVAGFSAAGARAGELKKRLLELRALNVVCDKFGLLGNMCDRIIKDLLLRLLFFGSDHGKRISRADIYAVGAAGAVKLRNGNLKLHALGLGADGILKDRSCRSGSNLFVGEDKGTDGCVRTDVSALVALDALGVIPARNHNGNAALLVCRCAKFKLAVSMILKHGNRQGIAFHARNGVHDFLNLFQKSRTTLKRDGVRRILSICPVSRNLNLLECGSAGIDCLVVHINDILALLQV